jgi:hypothetical protein
VTDCREQGNELSGSLQCSDFLDQVRRHKFLKNDSATQWRTQEFFSGEGVQQIQLRTNDRENRDLGVVAT